MALDVTALRVFAQVRQIASGDPWWDDVLTLIAMLEQAGAALASKEFDQCGDDAAWCSECANMTRSGHHPQCSYGRVLAALRAAGVDCGGGK